MSDADYPIRPVPFTDVTIQDRFWSQRLETNRTATIPYAFEKCEENGRVLNFERAADVIRRRAGGETGATAEYASTQPFDDTDLYKIIEGAAFCLQVTPDTELEAYCDSLIDKIEAAQEDDGWIYTFRTMDPDEPTHAWIDKERWKLAPDLSHEFYNLGHLYEAGCAYFQSTGKRKMLDICIRSADLVCNDFGPGKLNYIPGHQIIEMGLAKLYRFTGKQEYLDTAKYFLDIRGCYDNGEQSLRGEYCQDHKPVVEQSEAVGHAVRAGYMYAGMADVAAMTGDESYIKAIDALWENVVSSKLYITGGIGSRHSCEAFGDKYELPNMSAYCETCAAIANVYWNHRLFLLHGDAKYIDVLERSLYNNVLSGVSLDGKHFFYPNKLLSMGQHERSPWFGCSCCPSNVARFIASVPGYMYAEADGTVYVNLYAAGSASVSVGDAELQLTQQTEYPWDGRTVLEVGSDVDCTIALRVPGWAQNRPVPSDLYHYIEEAGDSVQVSVNGQTVLADIDSTGYVRLARAWAPGDRIVLELPMPVRRVASHDAIEDNLNTVALERGPLVYCLEWPDHESNHVIHLMLDNNAELMVDQDNELLGGVRVINALGASVKRVEGNGGFEIAETPIRAIPYYAWAHRGAGEMTVWIPCEPLPTRPLPKKSIATQSKVTISRDRGPESALADQLEPKHSSDQGIPYVHWWPQKGTVEFAEYAFDKPHTICKSSVYWFDDRPWGGCRVPTSWRLLYRVGDEWNDVENQSAYGTETDQCNEVTFKPVETSALRIEIQLPDDHASGLYEWSVE